MKVPIYIFILLSSFQIVAQEFETKMIMSTSKSLLVELPSLERIELKTNQSTDSIIVSYKNAEVQNVPMIVDNGVSVHIKVSKEASTLKGIEKNKYRAGQPIYPSYNISIPKHMNVQLFYDKGSFSTANFKGTLDVHLNSGVVDVHQFKGSMSIESFSGLINCSLSAARVAVSSNKGEIINDLKDKRLIQTPTSLNGIFKNANNVLKIKTIHAKVNLKSMSTQK